MVEIVTLIDINKAIMNNITLALKDTEFKIDISGSIPPNGVVFSSTNITENITRPSFYIDFEDGKSNRFNYNLKERNVNVRLFYFAKTREKNKLELLKIQDILENLFLEEIKVIDSFNFPINEVEFDVNKKDGYLTVNLQLYSLEEIEIIDASEYMEELEIK